MNTTLTTPVLLSAEIAEQITVYADSLRMNLRDEMINEMGDFSFLVDINLNLDLIEDGDGYNEPRYYSFDVLECEVILNECYNEDGEEVRLKASEIAKIEKNLAKNLSFEIYKK
ncbi:hypothetical protein H0S70_06950 [Chryseobacterium manosquense]|uniref:Uncharacterized protein n=1 Tax=Chryseobacterium manosquense TaxID=2754694 RepID=A0A7H1DT37_9FLAO|nr:hypothetical protein [Chryseobacterium manosquense]QNS40145.1 hypothetical protein H0S70_06950 [Chryseobacterium manosquense]